MLGKMSRYQAQEWDQRYLATSHNLSKPRTFLSEIIDHCPKSGWALDVAMGEGHNAGLLASRGMKVLGVDFSRVALKKAKQIYPQVQASQVDLPKIHLPDSSLELILNFWFLDRDLFPYYQRWLKPGGLLIFETMRFDPENDQTHLKNEYLLQPGELKTTFSDWELIVYDENVQTMAKGNPQLAVQMLARKPLRCK